MLVHTNRGIIDAIIDAIIVGGEFLHPDMNCTNSPKRSF